MAGPPSQATKALAALGAGAMAGGFYWFAEPRLRSALSPLSSVPPRVYSEEEFSASSAFGGQKPGWVFKLDHRGLGYYQDSQPE